MFKVKNQCFDEIENEDDQLYTRHEKLYQPLPNDTFFFLGFAKYNFSFPTTSQLTQTPSPVFTTHLTNETLFPIYIEP